MKTSDLSTAQQEFLQEICEQLPGVALLSFNNILRQLGTPSKEDQERLDLLDALEAAGVDNWQGYEEAMDMLREEDDE
jgi:hypothetical protein